MEVQFWYDSWDGYPPIISQFPKFLTLCQRFGDASWLRVIDFKLLSFHGQLVRARWKNPEEWSVMGMEEECAVLHNILAGRQCSSLMDNDVLTWSPN